MGVSLNTKIGFLWYFSVGLLLLPALSFALEDAEGGNASETSLSLLFEEISRNPDNLNANFRYAKLAERHGKYYESIAAYERMLIQNPKLDRVKLDLALLYVKVGSLQDAERLFEEVKSKNPPQQVIDNIDKVLASVEKKKRKHYVGANLTLGYTSDSNPSASPNSGAVDVFGVAIPLDDVSSGQEDGQKFVYASLSHSYKMPYKKNMDWNSEASFYKSVQDNESSLNTTVYSAKTGPSITSQNGRIRYGGHLNCSRVNLNEHEYLNSYGYDVFMDYILSKKAKLRLSHKHETRNFKNAPDVTTYEDRNGRTNEQKLTLSSALTPKDIVNFSLGFRREHAGVDYYTNRSRYAGLTYTKVLNNGAFLTGSTLFKRTKYKDVDTFVNPFTVRQDNERTVSFGVGKNITSNLTCSLVYQDKTIESNIQNYTYSNERITASMSWRY